jgi:hypothetical protein
MQEIVAEMAIEISGSDEPDHVSVPNFRCDAVRDRVASHNIVYPPIRGRTRWNLLVRNYHPDVRTLISDPPCNFVECRLIANVIGCIWACPDISHQ